MSYRFVTERQDYSDYASGKVFYNSPGQPAFPVRLASEIFQRCLAARQRKGARTPVVLYDPCCGSAYHLTALGHLHWHEIDTIIASDVDAEILAVAVRNLSLLTVAGLEKRRREIVEMVGRYGKVSHTDALQCTQRFLERVQAWTKSHRVTPHTFCADATNRRVVGENLTGQQIDLIITDVPYGQHSDWQLSHTSGGSESPIWQMLEAVRPILSATSVVAIAADKRQRVSHEEYSRIERFQLGKRQVVLLHLQEGG